MSWEEYIKSNILGFRTEYEKLGANVRAVIKIDKTAFDASLNMPCQVVVVDFEEPLPKLIIVAHNQHRPDMEVIVFENVKFEEFSSEMLIDESRVLSLLPSREIMRLTVWARKSIESLKEELLWESKSFHLKEYFFLHLFHHDPRHSPNEFSQYVHSLVDSTLGGLVGRVFMAVQRKGIEETVGVLEETLKQFK